jgi:hypothetical protein
LRRASPGIRPAENDAAQVLGLTQIAPRIIQSLADPQPPPVRIDAHLHAVEPVPDRIVPRGIAAAGDLGPGVRRHRRLLVDAETGGVADDLIGVFDHELAVGEGGDLAAQHARRIGRHVLVDLGHKGGDGVHIRQSGVADGEDGGLGGFCHAV